MPREVLRRGAQAAAGPSKQPGCISLGRRENVKNYSGFARYKFSGFEIYTTPAFSHLRAERNF
jgi:hypothetical protein